MLIVAGGNPPPPHPRLLVRALLFLLPTLLAHTGGFATIIFPKRACLGLAAL